MNDAADPLDPGLILAVTALGEPLRRRLLGFIRAARRPITRDEAADAVGISRKLAAFHLEKLVDAGLLRHRVLTGGPRRVGRRPKVYEPADTEVQISIPARRHELLADILTTAVLSEIERGSAKAAAANAAHERGLAAATALRDRVRPGRLGLERALTLASEILASYGFEPQRSSPMRVRLGNCPFHPIAQRAPELICQLNHAFTRGIVEGLQARTIEAVLAPAAGECCVELRGD